MQSLSSFFIKLHLYNSWFFSPWGLLIIFEKAGKPTATLNPGKVGTPIAWGTLLTNDIWVMKIVGGGYHHGVPILIFIG